ncbi:glycosyltransferase family 2 protein, partial [Candidatus Gottesmanbacteria bacterium]|nr:glycosyltransferase family 2 protein [Candidatus Gottesmanbacteria bacterium]
VLGRDTLEKLLICKKHNNLNVLGPKILDYYGKDIHSGHKCTIDCTGYIGYGKKTFFIDGCALMIGKRDFFDLGGFDEKYFMYSEDIDLCWRAHLYGMNVEICRDAVIRHFAGGTGGRTQYKRHGDHTVPLLRRFEVEKNNLRNIMKNYRLKNLMWVVPLYVLQSMGECLVYLFSGNFEAMKVVLKAHMWNLSNIGDTLCKRKIIQKKRVVGDEHILTMMFFGLNKFLAFRSIGLPKFK